MPDENILATIEPETREEQFLQDIADGTQTLTPVTRKEEFLSRIAAKPGVPSISESDEGKVLTVDNGEAVWGEGGGGGGKEIFYEMASSLFQIYQQLYADMPATGTRSTYMDVPLSTFDITAAEMIEFVYDLVLNYDYVLIGEYTYATITGFYLGPDSENISVLLNFASTDLGFEIISITVPSPGDQTCIRFGLSEYAQKTD